MKEGELRYSVDSMKISNPKITLPPADKMTIRQIAAWQRLATNHSKQVVLVNGLVIDATGMLSVDEDVARECEVSYQMPLTVEKI